MGNAFTPEDFELLDRLGSGEAAAHRVDALWRKAERLVGELGVGLFGRQDSAVALWPDEPGGERGPFLWARLKRRGCERYATHLGVFLSPGLCNLAIDLEKDPLEAGTSAERLGQVIDFYRNDAAPLLEQAAGDAARAGHAGLQVWTDTRNVVSAAGFATVDFDAFMAANRDVGHPWPKAGYLLAAADVTASGDAWVESACGGLAPLVPVYDAQLASFA